MDIKVSNITQPQQAPAPEQVQEASGDCKFVLTSKLEDTGLAERLNLMMQDITKRLQPLADAKGVLLQLEQVKEIQADVDEMKLSLAISNLVDNAVKYTPQEGTVKVILDADQQNVFITVADTGIGIPEDEVNRIFERFYRVDKTRDRETGGTGLGLSITHGTIMMHNGSIKVNSKEEEGTTILVRIPLHQNVKI